MKKKQELSGHFPTQAIHSKKAAADALSPD